MELLPIEANVTDENEVEWRKTEEASKYRVFQREPGAEYAAAMTEALNALLRTIGAK